MPLFMRRPTNPEVVEAEQVGVGAHTYPGQGQRPPRPGDWVVTNHSTGQVTTMTNEEFAANYQPLAVPSHLLTPPPGTGPEFQPSGYTPEAEPPVGGQEVFSPSGPATPMNESLPGRPAPTPEVRPRLEEPGPIESPTGLVEQPGDADKEFHEQEEASVGPEERPEE